ncbi:amino acid transporter [Companilactobacillus sp. RD055328]|uniref:amino acid permease n=1 Tax=Companilactobacillus sp. RD055328 TaxID=2916634 RepID=UPI001FC87806|nr:amino acid permease [Companilactobacillus sp. RD055328]GKQ43176.1 amino acid transporter [Companilactobacillus sp. RD055328]
MSEGTEVKRSLKTRHLSMIALGGSIGTGLFVASGSAVSTAGPGGAMVAYTAIGIMVYFLMTSLGEMATYMPVSGSFSTYANKFIDPAVGFALGWNYWFNWAITLAVDLSTAALVIQFWVPTLPGWLISLFFLVVIFLINIISVKTFAESEYWMSMIKVITVLAFLVLGGLMIFFGFNGKPSVGLSNFHYKDAPFVGGIPAMLSVFVVAGFSFQGTELIGITAGESETPEKSIPKAIKQVFWRILLFYVVAMFVIGALIPYTSPKLLGSGVHDIAISPFTLVFEKVGLTGAADVINAVILIAVLSAANSGMYAATRMLWSMGETNFAPKIFAKTSKRGIPIFALMATGLFGFLILLESIFGKNVYQLLVAASGLTGFIAWLGIAWSHYRFRKAFIIQKKDLNVLKYKAPLYPFGPILAIVLGIVVIFGQDINSLVNFNWFNLTISYMSIPLFIGFYSYYKIKYKTKFVKLDDIEL